MKKIDDSLNAVCCTTRTVRSANQSEAAYNPDPLPDANDRLRKILKARLVSIPGGFFEMGARNSSYPQDFDSPVQRVRISPFKISPYAVTNAEFAQFVDNTGYRTTAEVEGWTFVFHLLLSDQQKWPTSPPGLPWWRKVDGGYWAKPEGVDSSWKGRENHPVAHISHDDARAYCQWSGLRLPREAEWEYAARAGLVRKKFPWGNQISPNGQFRMNIWQGDFPNHNTADDGYVGTAPVDSFKPNRYGLYNMTGNVWEWMEDWFGSRPPSGQLPLRDPIGPENGDGKVLRGGSFLCHASYCDRYHVHSRTRNTPDASLSNLGFRVAASV